MWNFSQIYHKILFISSISSSDSLPSSSAKDKHTDHTPGSTPGAFAVRIVNGTSCSRKFTQAINELAAVLVKSIGELVSVIVESTILANRCLVFNIFNQTSRIHDSNHGLVPADRTRNVRMQLQPAADNSRCHEFHNNVTDNRRSYTHDSNSIKRYRYAILFVNELVNTVTVLTVFCNRCETGPIDEEQYKYGCSSSNLTISSDDQR